MSAETTPTQPTPRPAGGEDEQAITDLLDWMDSAVAMCETQDPSAANQWARRARAVRALTAAAPAREAGVRDAVAEAFLDLAAAAEQRGDMVRFTPVQVREYATILARHPAPAPAPEAGREDAPAYARLYDALIELRGQGHDALSDELVRLVGEAHQEGIRDYAARIPARPAPAPDDAAARIWIVLASGHGSAERPNYPPELLTRAEAERQAHWWEGHADTIGGTASVVRVDEYVVTLHTALAAARAREGARPSDEWSDDDGSVLWWTWPVTEEPYVGTPLDSGFPSYVTHWTPLAIPTRTTEAQ